jgi:NTE family protein
MIDVRLLGGELGVYDRTSRVPGDRSCYRSVFPSTTRAYAPGMAPPPVPGRKPSIGLVLSAGGGAARAYHAGVLAGLAAATGWDPRTVDLVVGTSAGSTAAAYLRAGLSAADDHARFSGDEISDEGRAILGRVRPEDDADDEDTGEARSARPLRASLALRSFTGRVALPTGLAGLAPAGTTSNAELGNRIRDVCGLSWPTEPTWVCAVRVRDGRRVVFGRDDVVTPDVGTAAQASCAIPRVVQPVRIGRDDFIDGATHSSTNADLVAPLAFDLVVIVSSMTAESPHDGFSPRSPGRYWFGRVLRREVAAIEGHDTPVLLVQPTAADIEARTGAAATQTAIAREAFRSVEQHLARHAGTAAVDLLRAAGHDTSAEAPHR